MRGRFDEQVHADMEHGAALQKSQRLPRNPTQQKSSDSPRARHIKDHAGFGVGLRCAMRGAKATPKTSGHSTVVSNIQEVWQISAPLSCELLSLDLRSKTERTRLQSIQLHRKGIHSHD